MTQTSPAVRLSPPPRWALKFMNPLLRSLLLSGLGKRIDMFMVLRFEGRRSHRVFKVPVSYHEVNGVITVFTDRPWRLNFAGGARVTVVHRGQVRTGWAELVDASPEAVGAAMRAALDNGDPPRSLGLLVARGHQPTAAELGATGHAMVRVHLDPEPARP